VAESGGRFLWPHFTRLVEGRSGEANGCLIQVAMSEVAETVDLYLECSEVVCDQGEKVLCFLWSRNTSTVKEVAWYNVL
jgi:hypothetical protein